MAKRCIDEILSDTLPNASRETYNKKWRDFKADYLQYFDNLHTEKK